jgi:hypothetical protein|nr:MAG TPA: hypothetical protein [Caudoviricetes sp.]DAX48591.1 MAG TPA: hypothetical protein [Caudoviricetes sp.]
MEEIVTEFLLALLMGVILVIFYLYIKSICITDGFFIVLKDNPDRKKKGSN